MKKIASVLLAVFVTLLSSCSSSGEQASNEKTQNRGSGSISIPEVTYQTPSIDRSDKSKPEGSPFVPELLQEVFPLDAGGLNRFSVANGVPKLMEGLEGSQSRMVYKNPSQDQEIALSIVDSGVNKLTMDQIVSWIKTPRNNESPNVIEKTGALKGFPSYIMYVKDIQTGEIHVLVNKRFEIVANGVNVPLETLQKVVKEWDLSSLY